MFKIGIVVMEVDNNYGKKIKVLDFRLLYRIISYKFRKTLGLRWRKF